MPTPDPTRRSDAPPGADTLLAELSLSLGEGRFLHESPVDCVRSDVARLAADVASLRQLMTTIARSPGVDTPVLVELSNLVGAMAVTAAYALHAATRIGGAQ